MSRRVRSSSRDSPEPNPYEKVLPHTPGSGDRKRKREGAMSRDRSSSPQSPEPNLHEEALLRGSASTGDKKRKRQDYETPEKRPKLQNPSPKLNSNKSSNSGRSTITYKTSAGEESKQLRRVSFPPASEETPAWAKLMMARFKVLETQLEEIQTKIDTLASTTNDLRSAFNNQQDTDHDED